MQEWSYTRLATFGRCPYAYKLAYIDQVPAAPADQLIRGKQVHEFAEAYARHCWEEQAPSDWEWAENVIATYADPEVQQLCRAFAATNIFDWGTVIADESIERWFRVPLPDGAGTFIGRVDLAIYDRASGVLTIVDYKTGWPPREREEDCPPQLACYAWAMRQLCDAEEVRVIARYIGHRDDTWTLLQPEPAWALGMIARVNAARDFEPTPSPDACGWCNHTHVCAARLADREVTPASYDDAIELYEQICILDARVKRLQKALRSFVPKGQRLTLPNGSPGPGYYPTQPKPVAIPRGDIDEIARAVREVSPKDADKVIDPEALAKIVMRALDEGFEPSPAARRLADLVELEEKQSERWSFAPPKWWVDAQGGAEID